MNAHNTLPPLAGEGWGEVNAVVDEIIKRVGGTPDMTVPILREIQAHYRYLPYEALKRVCETTHITPARITGVASFYPMFRHKPTGRHLIRVCHGTACHVKGAQLVHEAIRRHIGLSGDEDTDENAEFTIEKVACLGCCTLAPVMQIDQLTYGHLTPDSVPKAIEDFRAIRSRTSVASSKSAAASPKDGLAEVRIGLGSCCVAGGSMDVRNAIEDALAETRAHAMVKTVGCVGMCHRTPVVEIITEDGTSTVYSSVSARDAHRIVREHFSPRGVLARVARGVSKTVDSLLTDEVWEPMPRYSSDTRDEAVCAFTGPQVHIATEYSGEIDPLDLDEYIANSGFSALRTALAGSPETLIDLVKRSGLRGRGGAGFPTGEKWEVTAAAESSRGTLEDASGHAPAKYVLCNGDEGDPGAFMDRMLLESYPYRVLEGMMIAGYAIGASEGNLHIRSEYPWHCREFEKQSRGCRGQGFSGNVSREVTTRFTWPLPKARVRS